MAIIRRTYAGRWWFVADKQHLHHRLLDRGHSQRRAVLLLYVWSALISGTVVLLGLTRSWWVLAVAGAIAVVLTVVTVRWPGSRQRADSRSVVRAI